MMETREITVTIHREPEKRDDLLATLLIVVLAALAFTAGYIAANAQWRETISEVTPEPPVVAQETRAKLFTSYEEPTESITTSRYAEVSQEDCELIAKIVYLEARGEPLEGQQAVAEVILNRVAAGNFPDSVKEVIFQGTDGNGPVQFSTAAHLDEAAPTDKQFAAVGQACRWTWFSFRPQAKTAEHGAPSAGTSSAISMNGSEAMAAKKWIYEVKYTDGEEYTYTAPDGKLKSKKLPTVRVEAENRLNAVVAAAQKWGVGWTGVARGVECEIIGPAKKKGDKNE